MQEGNPPAQTLRNHKDLEDEQVTKLKCCHWAMATFDGGLLSMSEVLGNPNPEQFSACPGQPGGFAPCLKSRRQGGKAERIGIALK